MKNIKRKLIVLSIVVFFIQAFLPNLVNAQNINEFVVEYQNYTAKELIDIVDPYIVENFDSYRISNEQELLHKIGRNNYDSLQERLEVANEEKKLGLHKEAVKDIHILILNQVGARVTSEWWGKK